MTPEEAPAPKRLPPDVIENALGFLEHHREAVNSRRKIELSVSIGSITFLSLATFWAAKEVTEPTLFSYRYWVIPVAASVMSCWIYCYKQMLERIEDASEFNRNADKWLVKEIERELSAHFGGRRPDPPKKPRSEARERLAWASGPPFKVTCAVAIGCLVVLCLACLGAVEPKSVG
ncbi:MAG: hypothetical protein JNL12_02340 [Planctomycetes bacterium]|nr:hypothetical protein [Planctomycetota bacterium]